MKTIKMSLANIQGKLSRNEMKNIIGGTWSCSCYGTPGSWYYTTNPSSTSVMVNDLNNYCPNGGSCINGQK